MSELLRGDGWRASDRTYSYRYVLIGRGPFIGHEDLGEVWGNAKLVKAIRKSLHREMGWGDRYETRLRDKFVPMLRRQTAELHVVQTLNSAFDSPSQWRMPGTREAGGTVSVAAERIVNLLIEEHVLYNPKPTTTRELIDSQGRPLDRTKFFCVDYPSRDLWASRRLLELLDVEGT
jgi:hypothetical protein